MLYFVANFCNFIVFLHFSYSLEMSSTKVVKRKVLRQHFMS